MNQPEIFVLLARYNADMNRQLYAAAAQLPPGAFTADRQAFFGSLAGTFNHLLAGDTIWLGRFAAFRPAYTALAGLHRLPQPHSLAHRFSDDLPTLTGQRQQLDALIEAWARQVTPADLAATFEYRSKKGDLYRKNFGLVATHFFNHQTHHRGQASTLLTQAGVDIGTTDLIAWAPEVHA